MIRKAKRFEEFDLVIQLHCGYIWPDDVVSDDLLPLSR
jgi:hypothetical protein